MARPQRRSASQECALFNPHTPLGWRLSKRISLERGAQMVREGVAKEERDAAGGVVFVLMEKPQTPTVANGKASPKPVACLLRVREMDLIAGTKFKFGKSKTAGMNETQRLVRQHPLTKKMLPPEDEIERAVEKLRLLTPRHLQQATA